MTTDAVNLNGGVGQTKTHEHNFRRSHSSGLWGHSTPLSNQRVTTMSSQSRWLLAIYSLSVPRISHDDEQLSGPEPRLKSIPVLLLFLLSSLSTIRPSALFNFYLPLPILRHSSLQVPAELTPHLKEHHFLQLPLSPCLSTRQFHTALCKMADYQGARPQFTSQTYSS